MTTSRTKSHSKRRKRESRKTLSLKSLLEKRNRKKLIALSAAAIVTIVLAIIILAYALKSYHGEGRIIYIPANATEKAVGDTLVKNFGDYGERTFSIWKRMGGDSRHAYGAYRVADGQSAVRLARRLATATQSPVKVTFNNIRTLDNLADRIARQMAFSRDDFLAATDSILSAEGYKREEYPAVFLPDTYEFYWTISASTFVNKMLDQFHRFWNDERTAKAKALGLTPVEVSSLAAIVESESAKLDERPKIARLYLNRLKIGMRLQADPTVKFALGDFGLRRLMGHHLTVDSPYNTYRNKGLTPGPIRIPTKRTLDDVLNAPQHDYIYMCAKEDFSGYHNFAVDYPTHMANARRYQAELNRRGIFK
ncbi:MAG: endolytic transglycosylase MltG [Muribaculaceae bacterium]|nr:endolytic transglycosylase MltG [Muribaculaceae bacterium]